MDDVLYAYLNKVATQLSEDVGHLQQMLGSISVQEREVFPQQSLSDFEKVIVAADSLQKAVLQFKTVTLAELLKEPAALAAKLTTIRHDLRTPINIIKGYGELVIEDLEASQLLDLVMKLSSFMGQTAKILLDIDAISEKIPEPTLPSVPEVKPQEVTVQPSQSKSEQILSKSMLKIASRVGSILIVDDIEENRDLLSDWLERRHFEHHALPSGAEALAYLKRNASVDVDIVLLDIMMPEMDGFEVLDRIKADPELANIIVIMISALEEMDSIVRCIKGGAEDYLVKPFNAFLLDARITACLEKKRLRDNEKAYLKAIQAELSVAQRIQNAMLPVHTPISDRYSIYGRSVPAKEVGGDFYDWYELSDGKVGFCIGDVSGKGISAALFMAVTRTVLNTLVSVQSSAAESMSEANLLLFKNNESMMFVTLFYGILDINTGKLLFVNAGHWQPILIKASGQQIILEGASGPAVGVIEGIEYTEFSAKMEAGDTLFLYTDGVTEAVDLDYEEFGLSGLQESLKQSLGKTPKIYVDKVIDKVITYTADEDIFDDITCLALHMKLPNA